MTDKELDAFDAAFNALTEADDMVHLSLNVLEYNDQDPELRGACVTALYNARKQMETVQDALKRLQVKPS